MATVVNYAPIATQLARAIPLDALIPRDAAEQALRAYCEQTEDPSLPADVQEFFAHYLAITQAAFLLLAAPQFERLARFYEAIEEEYAPGGPSPVYDSFSGQFVLSSVPHGVGGETPYSVLARLLVRDPARARLQRMAQTLSESRSDLYRVLLADEERAELEPVRGGAAVSVRLVEPYLRTGDLALLRVIDFEGTLYVAELPYLLLASAEEWLEHCGRIVARQQASAAPPSTSESGRKLSKKERARQHQKQAAAASRREPEQILAHYFKYGLSERYWFEYICDAYAGERDGVVALAGVPDRPELLPHSDQYAGEGVPGLSPLEQVRGALVRLAKKGRRFERVTSELERAAAELGLEVSELDRGAQQLIAAYTLYGHRVKGETVLERFERSPEAQALEPELRQELETLKRGWFSVFRIDRIYLDEGLDVFDLMRSLRLRIKERLATRQLALGDLVIGWVSKHPAGTLTLEGGLVLVRSLYAAPIAKLAERVARRLPPAADERAWKRKAEETVPAFLFAYLEVYKNPPVAFVNSSGEPLEFVKVHYRVRDRARVLEVLGREFDELADGQYEWVGEEDDLMATLELGKTGLVVRVNSRERLEALEERLAKLLGDAVERTLAAHEDGQQAVRTRRKKSRSKREVDEIPPELVEEIQQMVSERLRATLDQPIPRFRNRTLRQLARNPEDHPDVIAWLREQERALKSNPQFATFDMRPFWQELSIPYQGLETDPPLP